MLGDATGQYTQAVTQRSLGAAALAPVAAAMPIVGFAGLAGVIGSRRWVRRIIGAIVVSLFMVLIWVLSGRGYFWPVWVMGGFLIGAIFYGVNQMMNKPLTEDQIQREMQKGS